MGILEKYVNLRHGWRKRLCVLKGGVLRYYKASSVMPREIHGVDVKVEDGTTDWAVLQILERARENGEISLIGNELPMLERKGSRWVMSFLASGSEICEHVRIELQGKMLFTRHRSRWPRFRRTKWRLWVKFTCK